jgi:predicted esterase
VSRRSALRAASACAALWWVGAGAVPPPAVETPSTPDPTPYLERRLAAERSLVSELLTAAQLASTAPRLSGDRRAAIQKLEREAIALVKAGRDGESSRLCYRAIALGLGRDWSPRDEYARSLVLRARPTVADSDGQLIVELGQLFATEYAPSGLLGARARLRGGAAEGEGATPRELGAFDGIASDLVRWPWAFAVDASDLEDGGYQVELEVLEGEGVLRRVEAPLWLVGGLEGTRAQVERRLAAAHGSPGTIASVRYPFDLARLVNLGRVQPRDFDFGAGVEGSLALLEGLERGEDPLDRAVGDLKKHYDFAEAGEIMPYRLIVPESYDGSKAFPLVVALHGRGGNEDTMAMRPSGTMQALARRYGYIVAAPMGYRPDGGYGGLTAGVPFAGPARIRASALSERDVLEVLDRVLAEYRVDPERVYLVGHSGGGGGVYRLAAKYPDRWAAIAPISTVNTLEIDELERIRRIPVHVSHGDADLLAPVANARLMVERMRSLGMSCEYVEVAGGPHDLVDESLPGIFEFFARHRRVPAPLP